MDAIGQLWGMMNAKGKSQSGMVARVVRKDDDGTVWVHIDGGVDETPITSCLSEVELGDSVYVTIQGGSSSIAGNTTSPSIGARAAGGIVSNAVAPVFGMVESIKSNIDNAIRQSAISERLAREAAAIAGAVGQHFWYRATDDAQDGAGTGSFVTDVSKEDFLSAAAQGFPDVSDAKPYHNLLMTSIGLLLRSAISNIVSLSRSATTFYDGLGNAAGNVVAFFGRDGARIGKLGEARVEIDFNSMRVYDKEQNEFFSVDDLRDESGKVEMTVTYIADGTSTHYDLGLYADDNEYAVAVSDGSGGSVTKWITGFTFSAAPTAGATITATYVSSDSNAKAFTFGVRPVGETGGSMSAIMGLCSALGQSAQAFGEGTQANGPFSHAEGLLSKAHGARSHAQNFATIARYDDQTAMGCYNANKANDLLEVGNGSSESARSNALELDRQGNLTLQGQVNASIPGANVTGTIPQNAVPSIPASRIDSGTFDIARIPSLPASQITSGEFSTSQIPQLPASKIGSGTLDAARLPSIPVSKLTGTLSPANGGTGQTSLQATRNAMGLGNTTGVLQRANGGTNATGLTTSAITRSGVTTAGDFDVSYNGVTITVSGASLRLKAALASGSNSYVTLGNIATAAYRPPTDMYAIMATSNPSFAGGCMARVMSNGNVLLYNASGTSLPTSVNVNFSVTWSI